MALTTAQLAVALRIIGAETETVPAGAAAVITRQASVARALVTAHAPGAPADVADEAVIRLTGFLYDQSPGMPRANNAMVASGAGAILAPWHVARLILPAGDGDGAAVVALDGAAVVAALTALQGAARLPATAIRDLPSGQSGGGLTEAQREVLESAVIIGDDTPSLSGALLSFVSDGGDGKTVDIGGITHPQPEAADTGRVLKATGPGTSDWQPEAGGTTGLTETQVDGRINALVPVKRRVPAVGAGDVGRILTAPQAAGGQPTWNSNPGQTAVQVAAAVVAGVLSWARTGNTDPIPAGKLTNAPTGSGGGGLTEAQVDARVQALVEDWAEVSGGRIPEARLPVDLDGLADAVTGTNDYVDAKTTYQVSNVFATVAKPSNPELSPFSYADAYVNGPLRGNVYVVIRYRGARAPSDARVRLAIADPGDNFQTFLRHTWTFVEASGGFSYYTAGPVANFPASDRYRVQEFSELRLNPLLVGFEPWILDNWREPAYSRIQANRLPVSDWAITGNADRLPANKIPPVTSAADRFVTTLLDGVRGLTVVSMNRAVQQMLTALATLTLSDHPGGVLLVSIQASTLFETTIRLDPNKPKSASAIVYLTVVRSSAAYDGSSGAAGNGVKVASFDILIGTSLLPGGKQGTLDCYIARNAAGQVGTYSLYTPESGASTNSGRAVSLDWEVTLLRTDGTEPAEAVSSPIVTERVSTATLNLAAVPGRSLNFANTIVGLAYPNDDAVYILETSRSGYLAATSAPHRNLRRNSGVSVEVIQRKAQTSTSRAAVPPYIWQVKSTGISHRDNVLIGLTLLGGGALTSSSSTYRSAAFSGNMTFSLYRMKT